MASGREDGGALVTSADAARYYARRLAEVEAECERLRKALDEIASTTTDSLTVERARSALEAK